MSTAKEEAIKTISQLPEEVSWDEIMTRSTSSERLMKV